MIHVRPIHTNYIVHTLKMKVILGDKISSITEKLLTPRYGNNNMFKKHLMYVQIVQKNFFYLNQRDFSLFSCI